MRRRTLKTYRQTDDPALTQEQVDLIAYRQRIIKKEVFDVLTAPEFQAIADKHSVDTRGGILLNRYRGFAKLAMIAEGRELLVKWPEIRREMAIPWGLWHYNISTGSWGEVDLESFFFTTKTEGFDEIELQLHEGAWLPVRSDARGFSVVDTTEMEAFIGLTDGQHSQADDPAVDFAIMGETSVSVAQGQFRALRLVTRAGEPFVSFAVGAAAPQWVSIEAHDRILGTAVIRLAPASNENPGPVNVEITAIDGFGKMASHPLTVTVLPAS